MRAMRLVGLLLVAGLMLSAGPAVAEEGRQFTETSGPISVCSFDELTTRFHSNANGGHLQGWSVGTDWTLQDGQLYELISDSRAVWQFLFPSDPRLVYHGTNDWKMYPVSGYDTDLSTVTGWYEGQMALGDNHEDPNACTYAEGRVMGQGYGDFAGQTVVGTFVVTDCGATRGLCPVGDWPMWNGTLTLQFVGKP